MACQFVRGLKMAELEWDYPEAFTVDAVVGPDDVDILGHTNNVTYLRWLELAAWGHSKQLGLDLDAYKRLNRAMVVRRHEIDYLGASYSGEQVRIGTWLAGIDGKLSLWRRYQAIRMTDGLTLIRGLTHFVCADFTTGRPRRMPAAFIQGYAPTVRESGIYQPIERT